MKKIARRMALSTMVALAFGVGGAASAEAQAELLGPGAGFIAAGTSGIATGELDDWLGARGYPTFGGTAVGIGLGAYRILPGGLMLVPVAREGRSSLPAVSHSTSWRGRSGVHS